MSQSNIESLISPYGEDFVLNINSELIQKHFKLMIQMWFKVNLFCSAIWMNSKLIHPKSLSNRAVNLTFIAWLIVALHILIEEKDAFPVFSSTCLL